MKQRIEAVYVDLGTVKIHLRHRQGWTWCGRQIPKGIAALHREVKQKEICRKCLQGLQAEQRGKQS